MRSEGGKTQSIRGYGDLIAYQAGVDLCVAAYAFADTFPKREQFALASQVRRAATSIPLNIAEGYGTGTRPMFLRHLRISRGSLSELSAALEIAERLGLAGNTEHVHETLLRAGRVLHGLIRSLERSRATPPDAARTAE